MYKIYIIIIDEDLDADIMRDRIRAIGSNYAFWNNHWLVETEQSARQIYNKLSAEPYDQVEIFVAELDNSNYYGWMNAELWDWIEEVNKRNKERSKTETP